MCMARSSSDDNAVHYVLLVLWIMSCFQIMAQTQIQVKRSLVNIYHDLLGGAGGNVCSQQFPCSLVFCVLKPITKCWLGRTIATILCVYVCASHSVCCHNEMKVSDCAGCRRSTVLILYIALSHYFLQLWFLSLFFFLFSSSILIGWRLNIYHTSTHDVALVRI